MSKLKQTLMAGRDAVIAASKDSDWRKGSAPDYQLSNQHLPTQRTTSHAPGSLEDIVERLVQVFEMEVSHKGDPNTWLSVATDRFRMSLNGGLVHDAIATAQRGTYNALIGDNPYYQGSKETFESSHDLFHGTFPGGFLWEVLEVYSPPPVVSVKWRHWGDFHGTYKGFKGTGQRVELFGLTVIKLDDSLKIVELEHFYDNNQFLSQLTGGCPIAKTP
jgi:hypothetical protein